MRLSCKLGIVCTTAGRHAGTAASCGVAGRQAVTCRLCISCCSISKQYVQGSCPDTRANNYAVASLNIVNKCTDEVMVANNDTCNNVINKGAFAHPLCKQTWSLCFVNQ